jgi:hypothetical protein
MGQKRSHRRFQESRADGFRRARTVDDLHSAFDFSVEHVHKSPSACRVPVKSAHAHLWSEPVTNFLTEFDKMHGERSQYRLQAPGCLEKQ